MEKKIDENLMYDILDDIFAFDDDGELLELSYIDLKRAFEAGYNHRKEQEQ